MQFDTTGNTVEERIDSYFCLFFFNLQTGDYDERFCNDEISRLEEEEDYEGCAGIIKALDFHKNGDKVL